MCLKDHGPLDKGMICFAACLPTNLGCTVQTTVISGSATCSWWWVSKDKCETTRIALAVGIVDIKVCKVENYSASIQKRSNMFQRFPKHFPTSQMKANLRSTEPRPEQTGCLLPESLCRLRRHPLRPRAKLLRSARPLGQPMGTMG
jgi:hypothetical protein